MDAPLRIGKKSFDLSHFDGLYINSILAGVEDMKLSNPFLYSPFAQVKILWIHSKLSQGGAIKRPRHLKLKSYKRMNPKKNTERTCIT